MEREREREREISDHHSRSQIITNQLHLKFAIPGQHHISSQSHSKSSSYSTTCQQFTGHHHQANIAKVHRHTIKPILHKFTYSKAPLAKIHQPSKDKPPALVLQLVSQTQLYLGGRLAGIMDIKPLISASISACFFLNSSSCLALAILDFWNFFIMSSICTC